MAGTAPDGTTVRYTADRLWDGLASTVLRDAHVDVADGRITAVGAVADAPPHDGAIRDLGAVTILPGLINAHVHATWDATPMVLATLAEESRGSGAGLLARGQANLRAAASCGVTTVRDLGCPTDVALALRDATEGAALLTAGSPITTPGGHCHFVSHELAPGDDVEALVARCAEDGVDVIKAFASGGNLTPGSTPLTRQLDLETLQRIVAAATGHGLPVAGHAHGVRSVADCVEAGVATVEHCTFATEGAPQLDDDIVRRMVEQRTYAMAIPGMDHGYAMFATFDVEQAPPEQRDKLAQMQRNLPAQREAVRRMLDAGVALACGTDAGIPMTPFDELPLTLGWFASPDGLQMSPAEALRTATSEAATACGVQDRGRLAVGTRADLLVVDGDPLSTIADVGRTREVLVGGTTVFPAP